MEDVRVLNDLNELLRTELSAVETYSHVLRKSSPVDGVEDLKRICSEHLEATRMLSEKIEELGGEPSTEATTWKTLQFIAESSHEPLKDPMAIRALKEGEAQDILSYEMTLNHGGLKPEVREMIVQLLLPRTRSHLSLLDQLLAVA